MDDDIHPFGDRHRLVESDQRSLDEVVALAVGVQAALRGPPVVAQERVVLLPDLRARRAGLEQAEAESLRLADEAELLDQRGGRRAEYARPSELCVEASRAVALDEQAQCVTLAQDAVLEVALGNPDRLAGRPRCAQVDPLLGSAVKAAC